MNHKNIMSNNSLRFHYKRTDNLLADVQGIIENAQIAAHRAVNTLLVQRNWLLGCRIAEEAMKGQDRAEYGSEVIKQLEKALSAEYGKGFTKSSLYSFYSFYKTFPEILLSWSHYAVLLQVADSAARKWYEKEARSQTWSVRTLQRNIDFTEKDDYYIVFYNYILKCFILVDLKTSKITHQEVGKMDMYIRMYDELKRNEGDNPTIGIVLCSDTDEDIARYSLLNGNEQLFASKYKLYLPTKGELKAEIEAQKAIFYLQQNKGGTENEV